MDQNGGYPLWRGESSLISAPLLRQDPPADQIRYKHGYTREVIKSSSKRNKRDEKDDPAFQNEPLSGLKRIQNRSISSVTTNLKSKKEEKKVKSVIGKAKSDFKVDTADFNLKNGNDSEKT